MSAENRKPSFPWADTWPEISDGKSPGSVRECRAMLL